MFHRFQGSIRTLHNISAVFEATDSRRWCFWNWNRKSGSIFRPTVQDTLHWNSQLTSKFSFYIIFILYFNYLKEIKVSEFAVNFPKTDSRIQTLMFQKEWTWLVFLSIEIQSFLKLSSRIVLLGTVDRARKKNRPNKWGMGILAWKKVWLKER